MNRSSEMEAIVDRYIDGALDAATFDRLQAWIQADTANAVRFMRRLAMHDALRDAPLAIVEEAEHTAPSRRSWSRAVPLAVAAALLLGAAVVAVYVFTSSGPEPVGLERPKVIATLIESTGELLVADDIAVDGREYAPGRIEQRSGTAEFLLNQSRVAVKISGDTRMTLHGAMSASLDRGSVAIHCPPGAEGYTLHLPGGARIVDLGTAFRVFVDNDGRASIAVTEGEVRLVNAGGESQELSAGGRVRYAGGAFAASRVERVRVEGVLPGGTSAMENVIADFGPSDLGPGDAVVVDLNVEPLEPHVEFNWFVIAANPAGNRGWEQAGAGGLLRTDRITEYDYHEIVINGAKRSIGGYTDANRGAGRVRLEVVLTEGFGAEAECYLQIDDDGDGVFDREAEERFELGPRLRIGLATSGGAHRYGPAVGDDASDTPETDSE